MNVTYFKCIGIALFVLATIGWILPATYSSNDYVVFGFGVFYSIAFLPILFWMIKKVFSKSPTKLNQAQPSSTKLVIALLCSLSLFACDKVPAGHVGVKVYLLGGDKGVDTEELGVGRYWIGFNEELYLFPTFQQNYTWTKETIEGDDTDESITFQTDQGLSVNADFGISYQVDPRKVSGLFQKYRRGLDEITDTFLRNMVRDALNKRASKLPVESVYGQGKQALIDSVQADVSREVKDQGLIIDKIYLVNDFRLPPKVVDALNAKIEATQKAQQRENEVAEAFAQARIDSARAMGQKMKQLLESQTLTPQLLQKMWVEKWDGHLPNVLTGEQANMLLQMPSRN